MIEPVRSGRELVEEIGATTPPEGTLAVWWLGQSGFLLRSDRATVVIDPYLSEHLTQKYEGTARPHVRMTRAPLRPEDLSGVDAVLCSHKHSDHMDPGTLPGLLGASPDAALVVPSALAGHAAGLVPEARVVGVDVGSPYTQSGLTVHAVPSAHEGLDTDAEGRHLYLGFVIEVGGLRVYHSGDGLAYPGLAEALAGSFGPLDVLFLPINGRDPARGVPGNMSAGEAVDLANAVGPRFVVPHHYDMFTFNTVPVAAFEAEARRLAPGVRPRVLRCGERWEVRR
jgi:L-ascorbate metabolism protein UlaG (beta-lactamase superfamily)